MRTIKNPYLNLEVVVWVEKPTILLKIVNEFPGRKSNRFSTKKTKAHVGKSLEILWAVGEYFGKSWPLFDQ